MFNLFWFEDEGLTKLAVKTESGWKAVDGFCPYFFVRKEDVGSLPDFARPMEGGWFGPSGEEVVRVEVNLPSLVPKARVGVTYLADLPYYRRYTIDTGVTFSPRPKVLYYDVEASAEHGFPRPDKPEGRILSIAAVDRDGREYFICDRDEGEIYRRFGELMRQYDFFIGYNSGRKPSLEGWDLPYLYARAKLMRYDFDYRVTNWGDLMRMYEKVTQHRAGSLASLAEKELGKKMEKPVARGAEIKRWFEEDPSKLREYNLEDCRVLRELDRELGLVDIFCEIAHLARVNYTDSQSVYCVVDNLMIEEAKKRRLVFPTGGAGEEREEKKAGALVISPSPGLYSRVFWYDFKSTYPSLISTFNVGLETIDPDGIRTEVLSFSKKTKGVFATVAERLIEERRRSSGLKANALKVVANSIYGAMGFVGSRYYRKEVFESISKTQQSILQIAKELAEKRGAKVLYADTDSLVLDRFLPVERLNEELKILLCFRYGIPEAWYSLQLDYKGEFPVYFTREKKRYVVFDQEGRVKEVKGFEVVRKNTPKIVARVQRELFEIIGKCIKDASSLDREVEKYLSSLRDDLLSGKLDEELVIRSGIEDPDAYKATNAPHVKAARRLKEMGYPLKEELEFVIVDVDGGLKVEPVVGGKLPHITRRAREHYWESRILPRVEAVLGKSVGITSLDRFL